MATDPKTTQEVSRAGHVQNVNYTVDGPILWIIYEGGSLSVPLSKEAASTWTDLVGAKGKMRLSFELDA